MEPRRARQRPARVTTTHAKTPGFGSDVSRTHVDPVKPPARVTQPSRASDAPVARTAASREKRTGARHLASAHHVDARAGDRGAVPREMPGRRGRVARETLAKRCAGVRRAGDARETRAGRVPAVRAEPGNANNSRARREWVGAFRTRRGCGARAGRQELRIDCCAELAIMPK